ncbi:MAG: 50S ribosomal protein L23 [Methanosarcinales archaeon]
MAQTTKIKYPFMTEKAALHVDLNNSLQFIVDINATKNQIKKEIERLYEFEIDKVRTMITMQGNKKAIVTFKEKGAANELASRFGIL